MKQFKEAHLEITTGGLNASIRAKGDTKSLILAWVLLTTHVSKKLKVPSSENARDLCGPPW